MNIFAASWGLLAGSLIIALPVLWRNIRDTTPLEDDLKFSDEDITDVAPTAALVGEEHEREVREKVGAT